MSLTITRNGSFRFETDKPIRYDTTPPNRPPQGLRVCVSSSNSKNNHIITHDLWNGINSVVYHTTPTITRDVDYQDGIGFKAERIDSTHPEHDITLHYENNPEIRHTHILYKDKADMLSAFDKDFPEQSRVMHQMLANQQPSSSNFAATFTKLFKR